MKTILVVDDDKLNLASAKTILGDDYKVIPVTKGQQALAYLEEGTCDIVLLNIDLPEMDGFEVMRRMRAVEGYANIPVIFLAAENDPEVETRCFKAGAVDFIVKPSAPDVMRSRIARALELEELRLSLADRLEQKTREASAIQNKSRQDALTGLWDRSYTEEAVNRMLEHGVSGTVMMMDVDNFKAVNDGYGHIAGDRILKMLAETLRTFCKEGDVIGRLGGDEFLAFLREKTDELELSTIAAGIIADLRAKIKDSGIEGNFSVSIGIARAPENGSAFTDLYTCADKALYYVKQNGKNTFHFFSDRLTRESERDGKTVDMRYLQDLMSREDNGSGTYAMNFDNFHYVFNFIQRFTDRENNDVQTVLFTASEAENQPFDMAEIETALELLESAIHTSLRRSDVTTRYSSRQLIVILMDANPENGDKVARQILENFNKLYTSGKVRIDYGIARMKPTGA